MKVLIDTSVWSLALSRKDMDSEPIPSQNPYVMELTELIKEERIQMIGPVRQEILSGMRSQSQFEILRDHLNAFSDLSLNSLDYERAAEFFNIIRKKKIAQGSNTDFLICAVSNRYDIPILTTDKNFRLFQEHLSIKIYTPRTATEKE